jgi:hypothetical protein
MKCVETLLVSENEFGREESVGNDEAIFAAKQENGGDVVMKCPSCAMVCATVNPILRRVVVCENDEVM